MLDRATFDAIRSDRLLASVLGPADTCLPRYLPPDGTEDRIFLRGQETYLELFAPENRFDEPVGKVGLGMGEDSASRFAALGKGWRRACGAALTSETVHWTQTHPPVAWYDVLYCEATGSGDRLVVWAMRYRSKFFQWQFGATTGVVDVSRRASLRQRMAAGQGRFEVTGLTLDVTPALFAAVAPQLRAASFQPRHLADGVRWAGNGWTLTLRGEARHPRLRAITFRVAGGDVRRLRLGRANFFSTQAGEARLQFD